MDGRMSQAKGWEKPIAKPPFPLPAIFSRRRGSELPTRPRSTGDKMERAHFFRRGTNDSGTPVYGFYITRENVERGARRD